MGKSTLFNRLVGSRRAIVGDEPGITRDRLYGDVEWTGRKLRVVDTGGIVPDDQQLIPAEIFRQARVALEEADVIVMVVDGRTELASPDIDLARLLLRTGKPLLLAVNKADTPQLEPYAEEFRRLGIKELFPISAENGNGIAELLDHVFEVMPASASRRSKRKYRSSRSTHRSHEEEQPEIPRETRVAIIGRPNVGKSTLLNALTGTSRAIVSPVAGTTRDAVDELVERDGLEYRFIDTAGIRRKGKTELMAEKLSVVMARKHLEAADVALMLIDATEGVTASDATIAGYAHESGRSVIIVINKWDLVTDKRTDGKPPAERSVYEEQVRRHLEVSVVRSRALHFRDHRAEPRQAVFHPGAGGARAAQAHRHRRDEPLPQPHRFRARLGPDGEAGEDSVHDAGRGVAAHVHPVHRPRGEAALLVSAFSGEPDSRGVRVRGHAHLDQEPGAECHVVEVTLAIEDPMSLASPGANGERVKFQGNTLFAMLTVNPPDDTVSFSLTLNGNKLDGELDGKRKQIPRCARDDNR